MGDSMKLVTKLAVAADGRTAENWTSYKVQLECSLAGKEVGGLYLDDVLLSADAGKKPAATAGVADHTKWARANKVTHSYIMGSLPVELHDTCAQELDVAKLWALLEDRFFLTEPDLCFCPLGQNLCLRLDDFGGVSAYLTSLHKLELELIKAGRTVDLLEVAKGGGGEMVWAGGGWWLEGMVANELGRDAFHGLNGLLI